MAWFPRLSRLLRGPLRRLIGAWVEPRLIEPAPEALGLAPEVPTLYVLPRAALSDALLLERLCARHGLPSPEGRLALGATASRACLALPAGRRRGPSTAPFTALFDYLHEHPEAELQLVPVSIFWGRAPGKRFGLWKLLAADSWQLTGRLRRALSVLINAKSVEVHFGAPLRLRDLLDDRPLELTNRKAARLLRVHFRRLRSRVLGPDLSHRRTLIDGVVASPAVRQAILTTAEAEGRPATRIAKRAHRYGREIASNMSYPVLRFMDRLLERLWNRLYDGVTVQGLEAVKARAGDHTLVYVPCHRSHIDYLLLSYVLYREGLSPPHIAAGRNLDMPLIGPLLRRGGAFFLRRSFKDNRLYAAVFNEYLHRLLSRGHPLEYFIEGGRSRSGRMLAPRTGMLAMTLASHARHQGRGRELVFVPVHIGYERILEAGSYQKELKGYRKRKESPLGLLGVLGRLRQPFGRVAVSVGEPLPLTPFLEAHAPGWRAPDQPARPAWLASTAPRLGDELARRINAAATLNPVNLVALTMLATPHLAIERRVLEDQLALLVALQRGEPGPPSTDLLEGTPGDWVDQAAALGFVERRDQALGELMLASPDQANALSWYRNNVLHRFALDGLIAFAFHHNPRLDAEALLELLTPGWPVLVRELFVTPPASLRRALDERLARLAALGLLERDGDAWCRPQGQLARGERLELLGRLMRPSLERGYLLLASLLRRPSGSLSREQLTEHGRRLAERLALLSGLDAPEFFDMRLFAGLVDSLQDEGWLWEDEGRLCYGEALTQAARRSRLLLDPALRRRLLQIADRDTARDAEGALVSPMEEK